MAVEGTGAGPSRDLGRGWKVSPSVRIEAGTTLEIANIEGPGAIQQIWMTPTGPWRFSILRIYWDDQEQPSVECPVGDFFACGWNVYAQISSLAVCVNPGSAFNSYWEMPFRKRCRITMTNIGHEAMTLYYQVNYTLTEVPEFVRLLPCAVSPHQPPALQIGLHNSRWRQRARAVRRHLYGVGIE